MFVRLYTGPDGHSHFEELDPASLEKDTGITFGSYPANHFYDWHTAPDPIYYINLSGSFEYQIEDGTIMRFGPGDVILVEDTKGTGHTSRTIGDGPRTFAIIRQSRAGP